VLPEPGDGRQVVGALGDADDGVEGFFRQSPQGGGRTVGPIDPDGPVVVDRQLGGVVEEIVAGVAHRKDMEA
jgi:hypothetical protein